MIKAVVFLVAIGIAAAALWFFRRRAHKEAKLTDKRARAEVFKQLLALSEQGAPPAMETEIKKSVVQPVAPQRPLARIAPPAPAMTRQQRRAEQRRNNKLALAKSQRA